MSRTIRKQNQIIITNNAFEKIMSWSQALTEVVFVAAGNGNAITEVFRLRNTSGAPRNFFDFDENQYRKVRVNIRNMGLEIICFAHSHPSKHHQSHPSQVDLEGLPKNSIQMISFPNDLKIRVWKLKSTIDETRKNEIPVLLKDQCSIKSSQETIGTLRGMPRSDAFSKNLEK
jgi:proteasome lid subunit RPN8/RPN11